LIQAIDHLGILVADLDEALALYVGILGLEADPPVELPEQGVRVAFVRTPRGQIELLQPLAPETPLGQVLAKRGEGLLHVCLEVDDIEAELRRLEGAGIRLVDRHAWMSPHGLAAFLHPKSLRGVSIELRQHGETREAP
jgi:methylmalonyl-CoA epimerase